MLPHPTSLTLAWQATLPALFVSGYFFSTTAIAHNGVDHSQESAQASTITRPHDVETMPSATALAPSQISTPSANPPEVGGTLPVVLVQEKAPTKPAHPQTAESITAPAIAASVNAMSTEDALKYLPSMLVRKRFIGDTQAPMSTRTTGINASARSLIYADGVLLSTLINNNNGNGSPQWFMVSPDEISRIDVLYGPYLAAYPGNSYGAVTEISTRMPQQLEGSVKLMGASHSFSQYATHDRYGAQQLSAHVGSRANAFSWDFSANHLSSDSQPLSYLTLTQSATTAGANLPMVSGALAERNRSNVAIVNVGAGGLTHTAQDNARIKLAYDFTPTLSARYILGYWQNQVDTRSQTYLNNNGAAYYGAASGNVNLNGYSYAASSVGALWASSRTSQAHWMQSAALQSTAALKQDNDWNGELVVSQFRYAQDLTRTSTTLYPAAQNGGAGRISDAAGTNWSTFDARTNWRVNAAHTLSLGAHWDEYRLQNPTFNSNDWQQGGVGTSGTLYSDSRGNTRTQALWAQDVWRMAPALTGTLGVRAENWRATHGYNFSLASNGVGYGFVQPAIEKSAISPKISLAWQADSAWLLSVSVGRALRFPTVGELYKTVQTGSTFTQANPYLKPEEVRAAELAAEHTHANGRVRVSLFEEHVADALISQTTTISGYATPVAYVVNVDKTRQRGIELSFAQNDVLFKGLAFSGSVTYVDARIMANSSYVASAPGATSVGKRTPYVPDWRATLAATYQPNAQWSFTLAGRYSGAQYATVDNTDVNAATYQGFQSFFVTDARIRYEFNRRWSAAVGVDNLNNRNYFLFHPFPQRTFFAELKLNY